MKNKNFKNIEDNLLDDRSIKTIETLKTEQSQAIQSNLNLVSSLEKIKIATEIEKKIPKDLFDRLERRWH